MYMVWRFTFIISVQIIIITPITRYKVERLYIIHILSKEHFYKIYNILEQLDESYSEFRILFNRFCSTFSLKLCNNENSNALEIIKMSKFSMSEFVSKSTKERIYLVVDFYF